MRLIKRIWCWITSHRWVEHGYQSRPNIPDGPEEWDSYWDCGRCEETPDRKTWEELISQ